MYGSGCNVSYPASSTVPWNTGKVVAFNNSGGTMRGVPVAAQSAVTGVTQGDDHALALKSDFTVVGWDADDHGQATPPAGLTGVKAIAASFNYSLAVTADGTVVTWDRRQVGQRSGAGAHVLTQAEHRAAARFRPGSECGSECD
jgi:hypothetical protein